jgi:hypothetical protein
MGIFDFVKRSVGDLFIASPPDAARALIWRHPDVAIPYGAKVTVRSDEVAVFFREGQFQGLLGPGSYLLETHNIPFLNNLLVAPLTGNRHCLAELFFVRRAEHLHCCGPRRLGTFTDVNSQLVVSLSFVARMSLQVHDPVMLITTIGGQNASSSEQVAAFIDGRITTLVTGAVGQLAAGEPITQITSNQFNEQLGQYALERSRATLRSEGLDVVRFVELDLRLDAQSEAALQEFGRRRSELSIQREGVELAAQPGFASWHLAQGQRAALEGLGHGLASGNLSAPVLALGGLGFGGPAPTALPPAPSALPSPLASAPRLVGPARWYLRTPRGIEGPFSARQLVLRARAAGIDAERAEVRTEHGAAWGFAAEEPALIAEFHRRADALRPSLPPTSDAPSAFFERALASAVGDGVVTGDELGILASLAESSGLATYAGAREYVIHRTRALGCALGGAADATGDRMSPPPPPVRTWVYSNGVEEIRGLGAEAVARRVCSAPDAEHRVWAPGMDAWARAIEVDEIRRALGSEP